MPVLVLMLFSVSLSVWFFGGIYKDREFGTYSAFVKHRPDPRFFFWAPVGESDRKASTLSAPDQDAERRYVEFVENADGFKRSIWLGR